MKSTDSELATPIVIMSEGPVSNNNEVKPFQEISDPSVQAIGLPSNPKQIWRYSGQLVSAYLNVLKFIQIIYRV